MLENEIHTQDYDIFFNWFLLTYYTCQFNLIFKIQIGVTKKTKTD